MTCNLFRVDAALTAWADGVRAALPYLADLDAQALTVELSALARDHDAPALLDGFRRALCVDALPFARWCVRLFLRSPMRAGLARRIGGLDELERVADMGLWHASLRYDPSRGFTFGTFAKRCVWGYMMSAISSPSVIHVPEHLPTTGTSAAAQRARRRLLSLDHEEAQLTADQGKGPRHLADVRDSLWSILRHLKPKHAALLRERYGHGRTLEDISVECGVSKESVRQRLQTAMRAARALVRAAGMECAG